MNFGMTRIPWERAHDVVASAWSSLAPEQKERLIRLGAVVVASRSATEGRSRWERARDAVAGAWGSLTPEQKERLIRLGVVVVISATGAVSTVAIPGERLVVEVAVFLILAWMQRTPGPLEEGAVLAMQGDDDGPRSDDGWPTPLDFEPGFAG